MNEFTDATETFLKKATFLSDSDMPLVVALKETAKTLDTGGVNAALVNQYRLTYTALCERGTSAGTEIDPLEDLLS
jgi:hypothetical protein